MTDRVVAALQALVRIPTVSDRDPARVDTDAFDQLLSGWRRSRLALVEVLRDLSEKAEVAGTAYVETESGARRMFGGETR